MHSTRAGERPIFIYALTDPETGAIRYIGKSIRPYQRLTNHCNEQARCHRTNWIRSLRSRGLRPALVILETLPPGADWQSAERRWIAHGREQGWPLTNSTSGGDGVPDLSPESRARIEAAWRGRKHKPETLALYSEIRRGRRHTDANKERMRGIMRGREITWGAQISRALRKLSDDQIRTIRRRLANGDRQLALASEYGVNKGTISNIKRRVSYGDVPDDSEAA